MNAFVPEEHGRSKYQIRIGNDVWFPREARSSVGFRIYSLNHVHRIGFPHPAGYRVNHLTSFENKEILIGRAVPVRGEADSDGTFMRFSNDNAIGVPFAQVKITPCKKQKLQLKPIRPGIGGGIELLISLPKEQFTTLGDLISNGHIIQMIVCATLPDGCHMFGKPDNIYREGGLFTQDLGILDAATCKDGDYCGLSQFVDEDSPSFNLVTEFFGLEIISGDLVGNRPMRALKTRRFW